jgi:hypothetical protein
MALQYHFLAPTSINLRPGLLIVPVNTPVWLTCEVQYNGSYSVQWYNDTDGYMFPFHANPSEANNSILRLNRTLNIRSVINFQCIMHSNDGEITEESNYITLKAISEGNHNDTFYVSISCIDILLICCS